MKYLLLLPLIVGLVLTEDLPPSCIKPIYCHSKLLHYVQMARLYPDSKTFVDLELLNDPNTTLAAFDDLLEKTNNDPSQEQIRDFVEQYFKNATVLEEWAPPDYTPTPAFLLGIRDENLRKFGKDVHDIWSMLGRKVKPEIFENPDLYSLVPVTNGFIIPGGRFTELYYWDTYWIIEGLLVSGMKETSRGVIENLIQLLKLFGHIPNGSRWYYQERSQPPLLTAMVALYYKETNDIEFLKQNIEYLEMEMDYWLNTQIVTFDVDDKAYTLLRYYAPSAGPRPESYYEDYSDAQIFDTEERRQEFYVDIKSAAESGWDFSSRWFINDDGSNSGNITTVQTRYVIPVDLNAIFTNALQNVAYFRALLNNPRQAAHWAYIAKQFRSSIEQVLWNEEDGIWYDYDISNKQHRRSFYPSNLSPLWMGAVEKRVVRKHASRVLNYVSTTQALDFPGGVPVSLINNGQQWDYPNAWPPLVSIAVNALEALDSDEAKEIAFRVAQTWVRTCYKGFQENGQMFEKYDVEIPGKVGGGGEYTVQEGFGWSNGVVLEFLAKYGRKMSAYDSLDDYEPNSSASSESSESVIRVIPLQKQR